jgi:hypothetical protein
MQNFSGSGQDGRQKKTELRTIAGRTEQTVGMTAGRNEDHEMMTVACTIELCRQLG